MKKALSLALALAMCLGLTVPAFAAKAGDTTYTTANGSVYSFSKPIAGTEFIKFDQDTFEYESFSDVVKEPVEGVTVVLVTMGTVVTTPSDSSALCDSGGAWISSAVGNYYRIEFSEERVSEEYWGQLFEDEPGKYTIAYRNQFKPGDIYCISSDRDSATYIFVKLVEEGTPADPKPTTPTKPETAAPTNDKLTVNGEVQNPTVYKINGNNYFKIRDLAAVLNGTEKQFDVGYDSALKSVTATTGKGYAKLDTDLAGAATGGNQTADPSNDTIYIDGQKIDAAVYKINGSNYFKLRDLGEALNFYVGWTQADGVFIDTTKPYSA